MDLSVIIATYNRQRVVRNTLDALREQTYGANNFEVILGDDGSTDNTGQVIRDYIAEHSLSTWRCMRHPANVGKPVVVNAGILAALSPLVAFTDDDILPCREWVAAHVARHREEKRSVVVMGKVSYPADWVAKSNLVRYHNSRYTGHHKPTPSRSTELLPTQFGGGNFSIPRSILVEAGMYDRRLRRGEDNELALRLHEKGLRIVYEPKAAVVHYGEAAWSYKSFINSFQKFYTHSAPYVIQEHHDAYYKYDHWFVEPPELLQEPLSFSVKKLLCRSMAWPRLGRWLARVMEGYDSNPRFYRPIVYRYILLCAAIEAVGLRGRADASGI